MAAAVSEFEGALAECGVTDATLAPVERDALDRDGYTVFRHVVDADRLERMRNAFEAAYGGNDGGSGTRHVEDLSDPIFDGLHTEPRVLAAVYHILREPFVTRDVHGRDPLPGFGQQGLHADWPARARGEPFRAATALWLLDDYMAESGATRVVPGTHLRLTPPPKSIAAPLNHHPDERIITASAGSVLVLNGHLWHSGRRNASARSRRVLQCTFVARAVVRHVELVIDPKKR
jgi:ectoine hydroxylase-related dioxygenase (phytanoyl-CoA dioxygenase family)